ncbi:MAG: hypothetical protein IKZ08_02510 [Bacteroidales bacterium]|nr:hypothetical protein [Bacteroidales bacterium]
MYKIQFDINDKIWKFYHCVRKHTKRGSQAHIWLTGRIWRCIEREDDILENTWKLKGII